MHLNPGPAEPFLNSVDPDHESALFVIQNLKLYQQSGPNSLIG